MTLSIRFVTCKDPVSEIIRRWEYGFWATHAEVVMPDGRLLGAHYDGGVEARPADYDAASWQQQQIIKIEVAPAEETVFYDFLRRQLGKPYDIRAVASLGVSPFMRGARSWHDDSAWFCSELVTAALAEAEVIRPPATPEWRITPRDLLLILSALFPSSSSIETRLEHANLP